MYWYDNFIFCRAVLVQVFFSKSLAIKMVQSLDNNGTKNHSFEHKRPIQNRRRPLK